MPIASSLPAAKYKLFSDSRAEFHALSSKSEEADFISRKKAECIEQHGPFEGDEESVSNLLHCFNNL